MEESRIEKLLALSLLLQMGDSSQQDKAIQLERAGFSSSEIAELLGARKDVISQQLYLARRQGRHQSKSKSKPKPKPKSRKSR